MQSASPSGRLRLPSFGDASAAAGNAFRQAVSGRKVLFILVVILADDIASSTAAFHWVDGIEVVVQISLLSVLLMAALAISPLPDSVGLGIGVVVSIPVALLDSYRQFHLHHPNVPFGLQEFNFWSAAAKDGSLIADTTFFLFLICLLMWISGGWLSWCVLRWRKPLLGLIPGAAALSTNLLNVIPGSTDQNGYTFLMMVFTIALLLWSSYTSAIANAKRTHMKLSGDARWDFWQTGLVATAGLIMLSIFLPPLSTEDRTIEVESGLFTSWAQLQEGLNRPAGLIGLGRAAVGTTGFSDDVKLISSLKRNHDVVFTYSVAGDYGAPRYFRGVDEVWLASGEWRYVVAVQAPVDKDKQVLFAENYDALGIAAFTVKMVHAPTSYGTVLFYPGLLFKIDRFANGHEAPLSSPSATGLWSIDRLDSVQPPSSAGGYTVYSEYSAATVTQLEAAGTDYPDWVKSFEVWPSAGYRPPQVMNRIRRLAETITAGTTNPYDAATKIEAYLRDPTNFKYTLTPTPAPAGEDPIDYFLFHSHQGYCEFFATSMGDMLRSLGIPTRLVNGYGPGTFDASINQYVVRADDAHTWVEAYFPTYGWIPFEPTVGDTTHPYNVIDRGQTGGGFVCRREAGCDEVSGDEVPPPATNAPPPHTGPTAAPTSRNVPGIVQLTRLFNGATPKIVAVLLALVLLALAAAARYLRPKTVMAVWQRTLVLASLAGAGAKPGETPLELGRRLGRAFPEASEPIGTLASGFTVAAYAPPDAAEKTRPSVMEAWTTLRPLLLRRILERLKLNRI